MTQCQGKHEDKKLTQSADHHHHSQPSARLVSHANCGDTLLCMQQCSLWR
jgi:hypothetical protein